MKKFILGLGTVTLITPITMVLFTFSPTTCGCTETWEELAEFAKIQANNVTELSAAKLEEGINKELSKSQQKFNDDFDSEYLGCKEFDASLIVCEKDTEYSKVANRGYKFEYSRNSVGLIEKVRVSPYIKWHVPNPSFKRDA